METDGEKMKQQTIVKREQRSITTLVNDTFIETSTINSDKYDGVFVNGRRPHYLDSMETNSIKELFSIRVV